MNHTMTRLISILLVLVISITCLPLEALAWGKMTHIYTANLIEGMMDNGNGKGSISVPYGGDSAFEYEIPDEYYEAIMAYPDAFRAGALGPDVYPDILTGQVYIHPEDVLDEEDFYFNPYESDIDSGMWITSLCNAVNKMGADTEDRKMCLSFVLGCILHYCGDLYGHDFVNTFSGGFFPSFFSSEIFDIEGERLNNILSHLSAESYMDDLIYSDYSEKTHGSIDAPDKFVSAALIFNDTPAGGINPIYKGYPATVTKELEKLKEAVADIWIIGGRLESIVEGLFDEKGNNVPPHYIAMLNLREFLTLTADEYREHMEPFSAAVTAFCDAWAEDVDKGIVEFAATCDRMARRMVTGEKNPEIEEKTQAERLEEHNRVLLAFDYDVDKENLKFLITSYRPNEDTDQILKELNDAGIYGESFFDIVLAELVLQGSIPTEALKAESSSIMIIKEELSHWLDEYGVYMTFIPDVFIDGIDVPYVGSLLEPITQLLKAPLTLIFSWIKNIIKDLFADWVISICTGMVADFSGWEEEDVPENLTEIITQILDRVDDPQVQLDHEDNPYKPFENNFEDLKEYTDILAGEAKYEVTDSDFAALYNTFTMFQLVLMGPENYSKFIKQYAGVDQTSYQMNTANPEVTSLTVRITTSDLYQAGTDDNIYMIVYRVNEDGRREQIKCKLLDAAYHNDFEQGDRQTYTVELPESVKLSQLEIGLRKMPGFDFLPGVTDDWVCENIRVTPTYAGYELTAPIDLGGVSMTGIVTALGMNFQNAMKIREDTANKNLQKSQLVTNLKVEIKVKDERNAGTDSDIYLKAVFGSTYWKTTLLDKGEGHDDLEQGKTEIYNIPITSVATGSAQGIPLDQLHVEFLHDGTDEANWAKVKITPCYGSLELTSSNSLGGQKFQERTWAPNLQTALKKATYRQEPSLSQTATALDIQVNVANEVGAGTDDNIYLYIYSNDSTKPVQKEVLDKEGYNDFERNDSDVYTVVLSEAAAKIPLDQMRLVFERKRKEQKYNDDGTPNKNYYKDDAVWDEVLVTAYNGSKCLTEPVSVGGTDFEDDLWDTNFQTKLKLYYAPVVFEYETNIDDGLLYYMGSLDGGEEWVDEDNELWANTTIRSEVFLQIFKGFAPEIEYTGAAKANSDVPFEVSLDFTGVWNGVSNDRRSQVKDLVCIYAVEGSADIEFINEAGNSVHKITGVTVSDNQASIEVDPNKNLVKGTYDLKVTYTPDNTDPYYAKTEVTFSDAVQIAEATYAQITLKTDGTPGCTVRLDGTLQDGSATNVMTGSSVMVQASAASGYKFKEWKKDGQVISTQPNFWYTPTENCTLTAYFESESYSVTLNGGASTVEAKTGERINFTAVANGLTGPSYQFYIMYPGKTTWTKSGSNSVLVVPASADINGARVKVEASDPFGRKVTSNEVTIVIKDAVAPMSITKQPAYANVKPGNPASLTVAVSGGKGPYTYIWQRLDGNSWKNITADSQYSGLGTATLSFTPSAGGTTAFRCVVKDSAGNEVTSNTAKVNAVAPALGLSQPSNTTIELGASATLTVGASGGTAPYTYTWQTNSGNGWVPVTNNSQYSGQGTTALTVTPNAAGTTELRCVVKDSAGQEITSVSVKVTANEPASLTIKTQPSSIKATYGQVVTFTVEAMGGKGPYAYKWQIKGGNYVDWTDVNEYQAVGFNTNALTFAAEGDLLDGGYEYRCIITDAAGSSVESKSVAIYEDEGPLAIRSQPVNTRAAVGEMVTFIVEAKGGVPPYTYKWQFMQGNDGWRDADDSWSTGYDSRYFTFTVGEDEFFVGYEYRCVITDANGDTVATQPVVVLPK